ncbi:MAG: hypothetical protein A3H98_12945 [Bacteroidetes bacterium RIFCSPLOWO2_02_FULL_36_8]|nr:MAG: hypothetical protein A3H98_12945 [Bacteroidetes bacterium RIFCSPLOWO2_02_FULL_36_8]OFY69623.1 MAG: hypothetical protein A3G23_13895 [Bacteroidetes bacterium RIFCSPLOWO2_12_FULL_37_12]
MENNNSKSTTSQITFSPSRQLILWLMISIVMLFAGLTSSVIVSLGNGKMITFSIPALMWISTCTIILSSLILERNYFQLKTGKMAIFIRESKLSLIFGFVFLLLQLLAFIKLYQQGIHISSDISYSYLYLLTFTHGIHLTVAIVYGIWVFFRLHKTASHSLMLFGNFRLLWHFLTVLWLYLFLFLLLILS